VCSGGAGRLPAVYFVIGSQLAEGIFFGLVWVKAYC
jgi:hypothetical protein